MRVRNLLVASNPRVDCPLPGLNRREFLSANAGASLGLAACASEQPPSPKPPNIVFILTDDQAPNTLGAYGNREIITPNLDKLAAFGALMTRSFCTTPVCSPSRLTLFSGQTPSQHGVHDWINQGNHGSDAHAFLARERTLSEVFAESGYKVGLSGKWHMGDSATPQEGFSYWFAMPTGGSRYQDAEFYFNGKLEEYPGYATDVITDKALEFIDEARDEPFFCFVSYNAPHTPYAGTPEKYLALYEDSDFETFPGEPLNEPIAHNLSKRNVGNRESKIHYYAMITAIDDNVGRITAKLDELSLTEDTLVVFLSDHGFMLEHHGLWGKGNTSWPYNMYDESLLVPAVFSQPGIIPAGQRVDLHTSFYDFAPTLLDYVGLPDLGDAKPLAGRSYAAALRGETVSDWDSTVYGEYQYCRMIREPEWKFVQRTEGFLSELYHLSDDPGERRNLVDLAEFAPEKQRLKTKMDGWFASLDCADEAMWKSAAQTELPSYRRVTDRDP